MPTSPRKRASARSTRSDEDERTFYHVLRPVLVDLSELFRLDGHLLGDVPSHEHGFETRPQQLHLHPQLKVVRRIAQLVQLVLFCGREGEKY